MTNATSRPSAIGVLYAAPELFRVRIKYVGDHAWQDAPAGSACCEADACRALIELGITPERARVMIDAARRRAAANQLPIDAS